MSLALSLHLLTLLLLAGGSVGSVLLHIALVRAVADRPTDAVAIAKLAKLFGVTASVSALLMVISGTMLLELRGWTDLATRWFAIKAALFVVLFANGRLVAAPTSGRLVGALIAYTSAPCGGAARKDNPSAGAVASAMRRLGHFHLLQTTGLIAMVLLAVLRPL